MKKGLMIFLMLILCVSLVACKNNVEEEKVYEKYNYTFLNCFDTVIQLVGYSETENKFNEMAKEVEDRFWQLHRLYDSFNNYEGINNIKTINDNAGIKPVKVDKQIIDLIKLSKDWYNKTNGRVNIAFGPVLNIWSDYRDRGLANPANAELPEYSELEKAKQLTNIDDVIIDEEKETVYLAKKGMSLNVGAVAKGYATQLIADELISKGYDSLIINSGGNVRTIGKPLDGVRDKWGIGIQNPDATLIPDQESLDTLFMNDSSLVTSGDYQRFYIVDGRPYHHIIDVNTLMPADYFRAVSIWTEDSGLADILSTAVFCMPYDEGLKLVENLDDVEAMWIFKDGSMKVTEKMASSLKKIGGATNMETN